MATAKAEIESGEPTGLRDECDRVRDERIDALRDRLDETLDAPIDEGEFAAVYRAVERDVDE